VDKSAAPPPNRSSATPSTGPGESLLRADVAGGQRRRGAGRLGALQRLDLRLLVHTPHDRMRRRLQGQPDHVADSGLQLGPLGLGLPGSDVVLGPPPRDRAVADPSWLASNRRTSGSPQAPRSDPVDSDALRVDLRPGEGWGRACVKGLDPAVIGSLAAASPWETTIAEAADASRSMARPPHGPRDDGALAGSGMGT